MALGHNQDDTSKKLYSRPRLVVHGDVQELTQLGGVDFGDGPIGNPRGGQKGELGGVIGES